MDNCIFCKIVSGKLSSFNVYEDTTTLAFLDINPVNKGHVLVIPKEHYQNIFDIPEETLKQVMVTVKKAATALEKMSAGVNLAQNNKRAAGQVVDHIHFHVIPRSESDGLKLWPQGTYEDGEAKTTAEKIKSLL